MPSSRNPDSFGTFLAILQTPEPSEGSRRLGHRLMSQLGEPTRMDDLYRATALPFVEFAEALARLSESGLVTVRGAPPEEHVALTPEGRVAVGLS